MTDLEVVISNLTETIRREFYCGAIAYRDAEYLKALAANALGAHLSKDGNTWSYLLGDNIQEGVCGFGKTPYEAALAFEKAYYGN
jgi:hypothetical protein